MDWKLEVVFVPVSDIDRGKAFYAEQAGFKIDYDSAFTEDYRVVQLTPPGSGCSILIGTGVWAREPASLPSLAHMKPGSLRGLQLVVPDIEGLGPRWSRKALRSVPSSTSRMVPGALDRGETGTRSPSSAIPTATAGLCRRAPRRRCGGESWTGEVPQAIPLALLRTEISCSL